MKIGRKQQHECTMKSQKKIEQLKEQSIFRIEMKRKFIL